MIKFLFSRMTEPEVSGPTWDSTDTPWKRSDNLQEPIWRAQYDWHCGRPDKPSWDAGAAAQGGVEDLAAQLQSNVEMDAVRAAYTLGVTGGDAGREELLSALLPLPAEEITQDELGSKFDEADPTVQAGYGLVEQGAAAVPALLDLAGSEEPVLRSRALDILGDIGPQAAQALPALLAAARDDPDEDPRRRAVEAIGTVGCGAPDQVRHPHLVPTQSSSPAPNPHNPRPIITQSSPQVKLCVGLAAALDDASEQVRRNAAFSLARLAPALRDAPVEQVSHPHLIHITLTQS